MARRSAAQNAASVRERAVKAVLRSRHLPPKISTTRGRASASAEYWQVGTTQAIAVDIGLQGLWSLNMFWRYTEIPGARAEAILVESAIALNVDHEWIPSPRSKCLVRYDLDRLGRGCHVQVHQFDPLEDKVHYLAVGVDDSFEWDLEQVLTFFLEQLPEDLKRHGWQSS